MRRPRRAGPSEARMQRAHVQGERARRDLLEPGADGVAVLRPQRSERLQHHQVERAAQDFCLGRFFIRQPNGLYPRSIRKSNEERLTSPSA